jgi:hypothetical protein
MINVEVSDVELAAFNTINIGFRLVKPFETVTRIRICVGLCIGSRIRAPTVLFIYCL